MAAYEIVEKNWPYDGPHTDDTIADAATAVERLVRYMANATYQPIESGPALHRMLSSLSSALYMLDQVLGQVSAGAESTLAEDPTLYDDRHDRPGLDTALAVANAIEEARQGISSRLHLAAQLASHLGHDSDEDGDE